jgi:hypothetical protein
MSKKIIGINESRHWTNYPAEPATHVAMFGASVLVPILFGNNSSIVLFMNDWEPFFILVTKAQAPPTLAQASRHRPYPVPDLQPPVRLPGGAGRICGRGPAGLRGGGHHLNMRYRQDRRCAPARGGGPVVALTASSFPLSPRTAGLTAVDTIDMRNAFFTDYPACGGIRGRCCSAASFPSSRSFSLIIFGYAGVFSQGCQL